MDGDVGPLGVLASLSLVVAAVVVSWRFRLQLGREVAVAAALAMAQLLLVGTLLFAVVEPGAPLWLSAVWITAMVVYAAWTVRRRVPSAPAVMRSALAAFAITAGLSLTILLGLRVFPVEGRTVVPLAGMAVGNSLSAAVVAARGLVTRFTRRTGEVEAALALGLSPSEAIQPLLREVLQEALAPQVERTRAVGLVALPGAMVGLILAGVDPLDAVLVQVVVMYLVLGSVAVSASMIGLVLARHLFTDDWRPRNITLSN